MMLTSASLLLSFCALALRAESHRLRRFENLVAFGDSYTDESRLAYFINHGRAPPAGELLPASDQTSVGGWPWGRVVSNLTGASYYNYAVSGAMCADNVTNRWFDAIHNYFPSVLDYEAPAFEADLGFHQLYPNRHADNTVYAVWIGTNDLGIDGFLTDKNVAGTSLPDFVDCVWDTFDRVHAAGGRHFVLLNIAPLDKSPMYAAPASGGAGDKQYWTSSSAQYDNKTELQYKMFEYSRSVNALFAQGMPFHLLVQKRWPGASFSLFDVHSLFLDIRAAPEHYLTQPSDVTGSYRTCGSNGCQNSTLPMSSFLWYDALHPSARTSEIVAEEFVKVVQGSSRYGTTWTR
ncbi:acetyl esterase [Cordyceps javanica]|uniref:Acetyl esterase n=1 Tax=Cordyceps javanica TaxID=43265 RepID=A0A545VPH8_9HYPO|nr:acetyl esterase [Cordyceps javanica]TQW03603.1 acetyl esterase [Cordyceps javanica]